MSIPANDLAAIPFGKRLPDAIYLHRVGLEEAPYAVRATVEGAARAVGNDFDVVKLALDGRKLSLLSYPGFFDEGFPLLAQSWAFSQDRVGFAHRDYRGHWNPPVLHRKELLLPSTHPKRAPFVALTKAAEKAGLFRDPASIGQQLQWQETLRAAGLEVDGHELVPWRGTTSDGATIVLRHRTALRRSGLSTPMQALLRHGYLDGRHSVFDYGCGHGDDLATLEEMGLVCAGWDPHFRGEPPKIESDVVNLGFVLNVIENLAERREALEGAFRLARKVLAVGVLIGGRTAFERFRLFRDGVLTARGTFQKYFTQEELLEYLEKSCGRQPVSVGPGLAFVFRDDEEEQSFLASRQTELLRWRPPAPRRPPIERPPRAPRAPRVRLPSKWELAKPHLDGLYEACVGLGRLPEPEEWPSWPELRTLGLPKTILRKLVAERGEVPIAQTRRRKMDDLLVFLALGIFERRKSFHSLPAVIQHDLKAFWGGHSSAMEEAKALLFSLGRPEPLVVGSRTAAREGLGRLGPDDELFFVPAVLGRLPRELRVFVGCATRLHGGVEEADLVKLHSRTAKLTVQLYDDFEDSPLPMLIERVKIDLRRQDLLFADHASNEKRQLLWFKGRYLPHDHEGLEEQRAFDETLAELTFIDFNGFGPDRATFESELARNGWEFTGRELRRRPGATD